MTNIFGQSAIFPGLGVDDENVEPFAGGSALRYERDTGHLQLSNNGASWTDVASGAPAAGIVAGNNIFINNDSSGNNVINTVANPAFSSVSATTGNITTLASTNLNNSGNINTGTINTSGAATLATMSTPFGSIGSLTSTSQVNSNNITTGSLNSTNITASNKVTTNVSESQTVNNSGQINTSLLVCTTGAELGVGTGTSMAVSGELSGNSVVCNTLTANTSITSGNINATGLTVGNGTTTNEVLTSLGKASIRSNVESSSSILNDPQTVLDLKRKGKAFESFDQIMRTSLSRSSNTGTNSKTRADISLASTNDTTFVNVLRLLDDGTIYIPGQLGIDTATPSRKLDVNGTVIIKDNLAVSGSSTSDSLSLNNSNNSAYQPFATLTNSGTADPSYRLQVTRGESTNNVGDIMASIRLNYYEFTSGKINFHKGDLGYTGAMSLGTNNGEALRISPSNYIGIGTNSPSSRLEVTGDTKLNGQVNINNQQFPLNMLWSAVPISTSIRTYLGKNTNGNNSLVSSFKYAADGSSTNYGSLGLTGSLETLNINGSGQVGIGTSNPGYTLDVSGTISGTTIRSATYQGSTNNMTFVPNSSGSNNTSYTFNNGSSGSTYQVGINPWSDGNYIDFYGNGLNRIRAYINSTPNTEFIAVDNNGARHSYFVLTGTSIDREGGLRYTSGNVQYYNGTSWQTLSNNSTGSFVNLTVSGNQTFNGSGTQAIRGTFNSVSGLSFITLDGTNAVYDYFKLGSTTSFTDGAMRMSGSLPQIYGNSTMNLLRPVTALVTITNSLIGEFSITVDTKYGSGLSVTAGSGLINISLAGYDMTKLCITATVNRTDISSSYGNVMPIIRQATSSNQELLAYANGAIQFWESMGAYTYGLNLIIC